MKTRVVVLASGEGSGFEALVEASRAGRLEAEIAGLAVSRKGIGALDRATRLGIPSVVLAPKNYPNRDDWDLDLLKQLQAWKTDWVALAGFLSHIGPKVQTAFGGRMINSHPSLLPLHGGVGMYGDRVHQAVLDSGDAQTGVTIHLIDAEYDRGAVLHQSSIAVHKSDTAASLRDRVKSLEHQIYPKVLNDLVTGRLKIR